MPNSANKSNYLTDNSPSYRKPPASESSVWGSKPIIQTSQLNTLPDPASYSQIISSRMGDLPVQEHLLNAREVAKRLGVSERWVRDHTTRRFPKIRGMKLGSLVRYKPADVEEFMEKLTTSRSSLQPRFGG